MKNKDYKKIKTYYRVNYTLFAVGMIGEKKDGFVNGDTEANARAKMLIYLLEQKLIVL